MTDDELLWCPKCQAVTDHMVIGYAFLEQGGITPRYACKACVSTHEHQQSQPNGGEQKIDNELEYWVSRVILFLMGLAFLTASLIKIFGN